MVETPVSIISTRSQDQTPHKDVRVVVVTCKCCSPSPSSSREKTAFLSRLNLNYEHSLIYPINGGVHAVAEDGVADSLNLLLEEYPSISKVILLASTKCACSSMARYVPQRTSSDINRISGLMAAHARLAKIFSSINDQRDAGHKIGVEMYHDKGGPVPNKIYLA
jgi:hypothetical protein